MCQCEHQRIEAEYAVRVAKVATEAAKVWEEGHYAACNGFDEDGGWCGHENPYKTPEEG